MNRGNNFCHIWVFTTNCLVLSSFLPYVDVKLYNYYIPRLYKMDCFLLVIP